MEKIAYLILAHSDEEHLFKLVKSLNFNADFYIHIDYKTDQEKFVKKFSNMQNVVFCKNRYKVYWAGFNMILATKELIKESLAKKEDYMRLVLLSGMDYPIKNNEYIYDFFLRNRETEFIRGFNICESDENYLRQIKKYHFNDIGIFSYSTINKIIRNLFKCICILINKNTTIQVGNKTLFPCFGSQWWALTPSCAEYVINFSKENSKVDKYFRFSFSPDEKYFHTIVMNSKYSKNTTFGGIEEYTGRGTYKMANLHIIDPSLSKFFKIIDYSEIMKSNKLFIRKVNSRESSELIAKLDKTILEINYNKTDLNKMDCFLYK